MSLMISLFHCNEGFSDAIIEKSTQEDLFEIMRPITSSQVQEQEHV